MRADNRILADGAASLAPSLVMMTQLTSLNLRCTLRASAASCAVSGCLRTPAVHWMMLRVAGCGACTWVCSGWVGVLRGASRGAAVRAVNDIRADGAASLAPSLLRMTQLTSLNLSRTLHASAGKLRCELVVANAGCAWMMLRVLGWGGWARGCSGRAGDLRGASRGAAVRADNHFGDAGAASLAPSLGRMTQLTSLDLGGTLRASAGSLRCERLLANAGDALMMMGAVGWGGCAQGCSGWWGLRGRAEGRRCLQAM